MVISTGGKKLGLPPPPPPQVGGKAPNFWIVKVIVYTNSHLLCIARLHKFITTVAKKT